MPPNLGGFFMVRSYYPSECHADYFDFERIEAFKPAIVACGIFTFSLFPYSGFFMFRSYFPSDCHADYFDFERIEALKPAIEACGISTLSQSPMLGFHKQMDNRIKLLEEILSFRMQGVEFDNGDMYVDGHKAA